ncbi:hypothetical protein ACLOJK_020927 [Asimina triloba]
MDNNLTDDKFFVVDNNLSPYGFDVGQSERGTVLKGLDLGVLGMRVGGQRLLIVPPQLAYGSKGVQEIPPNATIEDWCEDRRRMIGKIILLLLSRNNPVLRKPFPWREKSGGRRIPNPPTPKQRNPSVL